MEKQKHVPNHQPNNMWKINIYIYISKNVRLINIYILYMEKNKII